MIGQIASLLGRAIDVSKWLNLKDLSSLFGKDGLSRKDFHRLVEQLIEDSMGPTAEGARLGQDPEKGSPTIDAAAYLLERDRLADTLAPYIFRTLDSDGNGELAGEELGKAEDLLSYLNRQMLIRNRAGASDDPMDLLSEIVHESLAEIGEDPA